MKFQPEEDDGVFRLPTYLIKVKREKSVKI